jgi:hypothetical protein
MNESRSGRQEVDIKALRTDLHDRSPLTGGKAGVSPERADRAKKIAKTFLEDAPDADPIIAYRAALGITEPEAETEMLRNLGISSTETSNDEHTRVIESPAPERAGTIIFTLEPQAPDVQEPRFTTQEFVAGILPLEKSEG